MPDPDSDPNPDTGADPDPDPDTGHDPDTNPDVDPDELPSTGDAALTSIALVGGLGAAAIVAGVVVRRKERS